MKKLVLLLILTPFILSLSAQEKRVKSKVISATVYSQGAQITRVAKFKGALLRRILKGTIESETLKEYCVERANAFRANKQSILENLEAYRKLIKQQELEDSQK